MLALSHTGEQTNKQNDTKCSGGRVVKKRNSNQKWPKAGGVGNRVVAFRSASSVGWGGGKRANQIVMEEGNRARIEQTILATTTYY